MNVSSYIYGRSFYHRFDVRPKLFATLLFSALSFLVSSLDRGRAGDAIRALSRYS